jgi:hypothetical protein
MTLHYYSTYVPCAWHTGSHIYSLVGFMVFKVTFNNISVISWQSGFCFGGGNRRNWKYKLLIIHNNIKMCEGPSWSWYNGSWIYNYLCNQCLSPLMLWVRFSIRARCTTLYDKVCQWLATGRWCSPGPPVSSTNKTDRHDITEILLKEASNALHSSVSVQIEQNAIKFKIAWIHLQLFLPITRGP